MQQHNSPGASDKAGLWHYVQTYWRRAFGLNVSPIDPLLFVGGQFRDIQWPALYALGIRVVLSLQAEYEDRFTGPDPIRTLRLHVPDFHAPSLEQLTEGVQFIAAAHAEELPVLVHCHAGVGRAPATAIAYLMAHRGMSLDSAIAMIRAARPIISVNGEQRLRLQEWEQHLRARRSDTPT
jgi:protein-tyrosine phosphatase